MNKEYIEHEKAFHKNLEDFKQGECGLSITKRKQLLDDYTFGKNISKVEVVKMKQAPKKLDDFAMILQNAEGEKKQIYFENPKIDNSNAILEELETFSSAIKNNTEPIVNFENGTEALKLAFRIIEAYS